MDRRTFLAFVLIFLILAGYPVLMNKFFPQPEPTPESQVDGTSETKAGETGESLPYSLAGGDGSVEMTSSSGPGSADPPPSGSVSGVPVSAEQALQIANPVLPQTVNVRTPLYQLKLSTAGGRVTSWQGFEHLSWLGGLAELIPEEIPARASEILRFRSGEIDLGSIVYSSNLATIDLTPGSGSASVTLSATTAGGLEIRKIFTFHPDLYGIEVDYVLVEAGEHARASLNLLGSPETFQFSWNQGLAPTERVQRMEAPSLRSFARIGDEYQYKKRQDLAKSVEKVEGTWRGSVHFAGLQTRYFIVAGIIPQEQGKPVEGQIRLGGDKDLLVQSWSIEVPASRGLAGEVATARLDLFIGPQDASLLHAYGQGLEKSMDLGWKLFRPLAEVVLWCMEFMHRFISNYGLIIILFSIITKLMFYPLTKKSTESMKKMQEVQPKLKALQEKYKNDKEKLNAATMALYKEEGVNPAAGCLPLLVQSPVFIALYQALSHTITLRGQPFMLWMDDLSQPDAIAQLPFSLPILGSDVNVLPILMALAMYWTTKLTPTSGAGGQMAIMNTMMPLIMIFIFYNMPSGLVLYWLVNTVMQGYQTWRIHKTAPVSGGAQEK